MFTLRIVFFESGLLTQQDSIYLDGYAHTILAKVALFGSIGFAKLM
jgi:hypothetical protein